VRPLAVLLIRPVRKNSIKITARDNGSTLNNVTVQLEAYEPVRSRIFHIGGTNPIEVRLHGMVLRGGNATTVPKLKKSFEFDQFSVNASKNRIESFNQDLAQGDSVVYSAVDGINIGGLTDGETYTVINVGGERDNFVNPPNFQLNDRFGNLVTFTAPSAPSKHRFNAHRFERLADGHQVSLASAPEITFEDPIDGASDSFFQAAHGLQNGDEVRYHSPTPAATLDGLTDGQSYFVVNATEDTFQLALQDGGRAINIDGLITGFDSRNGLGGAILLDNPNAKLILDQVFVEKNLAQTGGGVYAAGGTLEVQNSTVQKNFASDFGGGIFAENANMTITRTNFFGNEASQAGGGLYNFAEFGSSGEANIIESDFANNHAPNGAAVRETAFDVGSQATVRIERSTVARNDIGSNIFSEGDGGGVAAILSDGFNLDDEANANFDKLGDISPADLMSLSGTDMRGNFAGASVGTLQLNVPSAVEPLRFVIDDSRFEVVAGALQLKSDQSINAATFPVVPLTITVIDDIGRFWQQPFSIRVVNAPSVPADFIANAVSPKSIRLRWKDGNSESSYDIFERDAQGKESLVAQLPQDSTSYQIDDLPVLSSHTYLVQSENVAGTRRSAAKSVTLPVPRPTIPLDLVADSLSPSTIQLSWQEAAYATGYRILIDGQVVQELDKSALTFVVKNLTPGTSVKTIVEAFNTTGKTPSSELTAELPPNIPSIPSGFSVQKLTATSLRLSWNDSDSETEYRVFRRVGSGPEEELVKLAGNTTTTDVTGLVSNVTYSFFVRAINISGASSSVSLQTNIQSGSKIETIFFEGSGQEIDLTPIENDLYPQLQNISIDGSGPNSITLKAPDIVNLVKSDNDINLIAGRDDKIKFSGDWHLTGGTVVGDKFYRNLQSGDAVVHLDRPDSWHNPIHDTDVSGDGQIFPLDALLVINELNANKFSDPKTHQLVDPTTLPHFDNRFLDTDGDGRVFPIDALLVINELNRRGGGGEGESEIFNNNLTAMATPISTVQGIDRLDRPNNAFGLDTFYSVVGSNVNKSTPFEGSIYQTNSERLRFANTAGCIVGMEESYGTRQSENRTGSPPKQIHENVWAEWESTNDNGQSVHFKATHGLPHKPR